MKFVSIEIPCVVKHWGPNGVEKTEPGVLELKMTTGDNATSKDVLEQLAEKFDGKMNLLDLGDST